MPVTVRRLMRQSSLRLTLANRGHSLDEPIHWIYGSDLVDPTPFLTAGQMILTTGTQFPESAGQSEYDAYIDRLIARRVVALGFGTEVIRSGTPGELVTACTERGLPLVEVPYVTPFIAIIRWAADIVAHEARARDDWALGAQRAISLAALGDGALTSVLAALATQLDCRVAMFDSEGTIDIPLSPGAFDPTETAILAADATHLLRAGRRAASTVPVGTERATLQTLGQRGHLRGVLAIVGGMEQDSAAQAVVTTAVALAEVSLEQSMARRGSLMPLHEELFALLIAGQPEIVVRALPGFPKPPFFVVLCARETVSESFDDALERRATDATSRLFFAPHESGLVLLVPTSDRRKLEDLLRRHEVTVGISDAASFDQLATGLAQARRALDAALRRGDTLVDFASMRKTDFGELLSRPEVADVAAAHLEPLLADEAGRTTLRWAAIWLAHNGRWDPAAKQLGLHRHTLKARIEQLGRALDLTLETFAGRAQLWAMLAALNLEVG